jgi:hypothetical protein
MQRPGETLIGWGDTLLKTIERASQREIKTIVKNAAPQDGSSGKGIVEATVLLRAANHSECWLLVEGGWSDAFPAPTYRELVIWSITALPWSVVIHFAENYWQTTGDVSRTKRVIAITKASCQLLTILALAPISIGLLALALLLGLLPIPQLRTAILSAQSVLTATIGDSFAFVESPVRAALIRTRIINALNLITPRCLHTVIIAHSQGAAVVLDVLGAFTPEKPDEKLQFAALHASPDTLITFGAGTKKLASQLALSRGLPPKSFDPVSFGVAGFLTTSASVLWIYFNFPPLWDWLLMGMIYALVTGLIWASVWAMRRLKARYDRADEIAIKVFPVSFTILIFCGIILMLWYGFSFPSFAVVMLPPFLLVLAVSIAFMLSKDMEQLVVAPVRIPSGLRRWVDFYASADPVPNGKTTIVDREHESIQMEPIQIWNLGSMIADHTSYWSNRDEFVLRVAKICTETAQSPWLSLLPRTPSSIDDQAAWRVGFLRLATASCGVTWLVLGAFLWTQYRASIPLILDIPGWVPPSTARFILLVSFILFGVWASTWILRWPWSQWVRSEQEAVLAPSGVKRETLWSPGFTIFVMAFLVCSLITTVILVIIRPDIDLYHFLTFDNLLQYFALLIGPAVVITFILLWIRPSPDAQGG